MMGQMKNALTVKSHIIHSVGDTLPPELVLASFQKGGRRISSRLCEWQNIQFL